MTHAEMILEQLSAWKPVGPGPHELQVNLDQPETAVTFSAVQTDAFSVLLNDISMTIGPVDCSNDELVNHAVDMTRRITALADPVKVYEVDAIQSTALLRSTNPVERAGKVFYFEVTLAGRHAVNIRRYQIGKTSGARSSIPFALTHEAVAKVVEEIIC